MLDSRPDGTRYAAPLLLAHYVREHRYAPPQEFIDAVLRVSVTWEEAEARDLCISCGRAMQRTNYRDRLVRGERREPVVVVDLACAGCGTIYLRSFPDVGAGRS